MTVVLSWLKKSPQPSAVSVGAQTLVVPPGRKRWGQLAETIATTANAGDRLSAFDEAGALLRAMTYEGDQAEEEQTDSPGKQATDLQVFANLLASATDRVMTRDEAMFSRVFEAQNSMMQTFASRLSSLESAWHKQVVESAKTQAAMIQLAAESQAAAGDGGDLMSQMVSAFMAAQGSPLMAGPPASPPVTKDVKK